MRFIAENVIDDCKLASKQLKVAETKENQQIIRISWFTCLALLKATSDILLYVDSVKFQKHKHIFDSNFLRHKKDPVFVDFIRFERNKILKEFKIYIDYEVTINDENHQITTEDGDILSTENGHMFVTEQTESIIRNAIKSKRFGKGKLLHQVVSEAISWYETRITEIKTEINKVT
jgi:hypothetical protein